MEITAANFNERLPEIEKAISSATFMAIDGEFTGLSAHNRLSPFDTPAERYGKVKDSARYESQNYRIKILSILYFLQAVSLGSVWSKHVPLRQDQ